MGEDMKSLLQQRANLKARITIFSKYIEPFKIIEPKALTPLLCTEVQIKLERFRELFASFDIIQTQIETLPNDEKDLQSQLAERERMEDAFCSLIAIAQNIIEKYHNVSKQGDSEGSSRSSCGHKHSNVRLPTINLPTFDGNHLHWMEFRDTFDSLINKANHFQPIDKFHYLRNSLKGAAAVVIQSVEFSGDNYSMAWDLLCDRFNNKRILINNHLKCLFQFEPLQKESYKALRYMIDTYTKNLRALDNLDESTEHWDTLIIFIMISKLDSVTVRKWEEGRNDSSKSPTLKEFLQFLRGRADFLETIQFGKNENTKSEKPHSKENKNTTKSFVSSSGNTKPNKCVLCKQNHFLHECDQFKDMTVEDRYNFVLNNKLCHNCFRTGHHNSNCRLGPCKICKKKHNSLIHKNIINKNENNGNSSPQLMICGPKPTENVENSTANSGVNSNPITLSAMMSSQVLLCTAEVQLIDPNTKQVYLAKALLDNGSQSSLLTEKAKNKMQLSSSSSRQVSVTGINNSVTNTSEICDIQLKSKVNSFSINVSCLVIPEITNQLPSVEVDTTQIQIPSNVILADPTFFRPSEIHILLGADVFWDIVESNQIKTGRNKPTLLSSKLGWLVAGPTGSSPHPSNNVKCNFSQDIGERITKFWEIESLPGSSNILTKDEEHCETHFANNTKRLDDGRFSVLLPFSESPEVALGDSYTIAKRRFLNLEKRLSKVPNVKKDYTNFIHEYEQLGHLSQIQKPLFGNYLPHHAVIQEQRESTKLRVVFDASCKTSSGKSFNDIQLVGPVVQDDLLSILLRFRQNAYVVTGDVEKMYRQIHVDESQRHLQLILWRDEECQPLKTLQLNTVTYGTASAPFLSTRCLVQLGEECTDEAVARAIKHDFYVDDLITGSETKTNLKHVMKGVVQKLNEGCFPLRKFRTNSPDILQDLPVSHQTQDFSKESTVLGLKWSPDQDLLHFSVDVQSITKVTKRSILSKSSKIFDPLGLLSACTIVPKIILQKLWLLKSDWDESVPAHILSDWTKFESTMGEIANITVPRHVLCSFPVQVEAHCFTDASEAAYGACLYLKSTDKDGNCSINLLCAKARVAPLKPEMTIPRLELLGALLGARLYEKVSKALNIQFTRSIFWSDSTIVLGWIKTQPKTLKTFVCNRIQEIRELTDQNSWRHVGTSQNPADLASRGVKPQDLIGNKLWWNGPEFLGKTDSEWPQNPTSNAELPETKVTLLHLQNEHSIVPYERFSNLTNLQRVFAYVLRFISNCKTTSAKTKDELTKDELQASLNLLAKLSQRESFQKDINSLKLNKSLNQKSNILTLNPFLDAEGILRVGGRIQNALFCSYSKVHPILIDAKHPFTRLLFEREHLRLLHCGPQQLLCSIREQFWPTGGRVLAKTTINKCFTCNKLKPKSIQPIMGNLPTPRVTPSPPFEICGTDFAGPFFVLNRKGRGSKSSKCYLCIFVCFSTKAVHLEIVSDLTTNAFILCFRRFISRRGKPRVVYCDNGKNFVGARGEIIRMLRAHNQSVSEFAREDGFEFKFIPPYSPNFGGLWEAGVKAAKFHVKRIAGNTNLTYEELSTLFAQIESILNSRPLVPLSEDPSDLNPLTPGHFLIGRPLSSLPSPISEKLSLNRYELLERLRQHFWSRWHKEYLSELQRRVKWKTSQGSCKIGDLVLIKEDNLPPMKWITGRIEECHFGHDGICRVVDIRTSKGTVRRALSRVCPLLPHRESQESLES